MTKLFIHTEPFRKCWKAMGLSDSDLSQLEEILLENSQKGDVIEGTGGARKLRITLNDNRGKSGGGRVIYIDIFEKSKIYRKRKISSIPQKKRACLSASSILY